eukprot:5436054-Pleurochrysis_carterae.AAC.2
MVSEKRRVDASSSSFDSTAAQAHASQQDVESRRLRVRQLNLGAAELKGGRGQGRGRAGQLVSGSSCRKTTSGCVRRRGGIGRRASKTPLSMVSSETSNVPPA